MKRLILLCLTLGMVGGSAFAQPRFRSFDPQYTEQRELLLPDGYRQWVSVRGEPRSDCTTDSTMTAKKRGFVDHIYIEPSAYKYYLENGGWPDKAVIVMEVRKPRQDRSARRGNPSDLVALEVAVKDDTDSEQWSYFARTHFSKDAAAAGSDVQPEKLLAHSHPTLRAVIEGRVPIMDTFF
ncbi:MAG TPA: cytochrome P460 family protein [Terriglobales bacterium]|nr:cytochrome P460 family protein [Terriglobales bacterium]